jgi:hypothetical protein
MQALAFFTSGRSAKCKLSHSSLLAGVRNASSCFLHIWQRCEKKGHVFACPLTEYSCKVY